MIGILLLRPYKSIKTSPQIHTKTTMIQPNHNFENILWTHEFHNEKSAQQS